MRTILTWVGCRRTGEGRWNGIAHDSAKYSPFVGIKGLRISIQIIYGNSCSHLGRVDEYELFSSMAFAEVVEDVSG